MKLIPYLICLFLLIGTMSGFAQKKERQELRSGNKHYEKEEYAEAEMNYRKALEVNSKSIKSYYNTGNAIYRQLKPEQNKEVSEEEKARMTEAVDHYKTVTKLSDNKMDKAQAWHNIGNVFMLTGNYEQSVDAYKNSLLNNPNDHETRYNYILAKELLKNQQNQQQNQPQDNKDQEKEQNKDQNQQQQNDQNQQNQDQQQQNKMSQENAEQILNAIKQQEQETQEKRQQGQAQQPPNRPEKDW